MSEHRELYGKELDPKVLSNLILIKRTDRPDEWGMDELSRKAFELEKENAELKASIEHRNHIENIDHVLSQKTDFRGVFSKIEIDIQPPKGFIKWKEQGE